jgi:hypothetical protein
MPQRKWSPEDWAWAQIRAGKLADFHKHLGECDPKDWSGWGDDRRLSTAFLRKIFYDKPFADHMPPEGARIVGAWFPEGVALPDGHLHRQLRLDRSRFEKPIDLSNLTVDGALSFEESFVAATLGASAIDLGFAKIDGQVSLKGATVEGELMMNRLEVGRHLWMRSTKQQPARFKAVSLRAAKIAGNFDLAFATVEGALMMDELEVGQDLWMRGSQFADVNLTAAKIDGVVSLDGATVEGELIMIALHGGILWMRGSEEEPAEFADVDLTGAKINGECSLDEVMIKGKLNMKSLVVGQDLLLKDVAACSELDLSGSKVQNELRLPSQVWSGNCQLFLRNAHASVLHDREDAWPRQVELDGFTYDRWRGLGENGDPRGDAWFRRKWYKRWLAKDQTYSPQPYEQLASVLRKSGEPAMASYVLYEGREMARRAAWFKWRYFRGGRIELFRFIGMTLLKSTIGYGLGLLYFRSLWWIVGFTALGMAVLFLGATVLDTNTGLTKAQLGFGDSLVFSLQKLLPLVQFEKFDQVQLGPFARWYFYIHQLAGYVLALFLGAGLAGLTQKS